MVLVVGAFSLHTPDKFGVRGEERIPKGNLSGIPPFICN